MPIVGDVVNEMLRRLRDAGATGTQRSVARSVLTEAQRAVNAKLGFVLGTDTLATTANTQLYSIPTLLPNTIKILRIIENNRDLQPVDWRTLVQVDRRWLAATGARFEAWATIGRDILVIHPAKSADSSVSVIYARLTSALTSDAQMTELDDDQIDFAVELSLVVLLLRARILEPLKVLLTRFADRLSIEKTQQ